VIANGKIGFGITAVDYDNVSFNKNGIYKLQTFLNGKPNFGYQFDTYSFDDMRYINALVDYPRYRKTYQRVQLFMTNPYKLSIIKQMRQMVLLLSFLICLQYTESKFQILWEIKQLYSYKL
jgi:hypothetical protein